METRNQKILVVDDEPQLLKLAVAILANANIDCDTAETVAKAREMMSGETYTIVVADIGIPGNRDLSFVKELAVLRPDLPVVVITGEPTLETAIVSANLNVAGYLVKPFTAAEFERTVRAATINAEMLQRSVHAEAPPQKVLIRDFEIIKSKLYAEAKPHPLGIDEFVSLTATNIVQSLEDLKSLADGFSAGRGSRVACHLFDCPRLARQTEALKDAISVLEKTKNAFKSKELGELRKRLEVAIEEEKME